MTIVPPLTATLLSATQFSIEFFDECHSFEEDKFEGQRCTRSCID